MELLLQKYEMLDLGEQLRGMSILCRQGCCWLTQARDSRDHILRSGEHFSVKQSGRLILTATEECRLMLVATAKMESTTLWKQLHCN